MTLLPILLVIVTLICVWKVRKFYVLAWKMGGPNGYPIIGSVLTVYYLDSEFF